MVALSLPPCVDTQIQGRVISLRAADACPDLPALAPACSPRPWPLTLSAPWPPA